ncbi:MAG: DUF3638 domain-containing protein [Candidatus Margulisiibacteriota bacterium]|jgi:hypothetical protein
MEITPALPPKQEPEIKKPAATKPSGATPPAVGSALNPLLPPQTAAALVSGSADSATQAVAASSLAVVPPLRSFNEIFASQMPQPLTKPVIPTHPKIQIPDLHGLVDAHNLALIFGDSWIEGTEFEGGSPLAFACITVQILKDLISSLQKKDPDIKILTSLQKEFTDLILLNINKKLVPIQKPEEKIQFLIQEYLRKIQKLKEGESILIPGGWCGVDHGHNILYEVTGEKGGTCSFSLFNTGAGVNYHDHIFIDHKIRYTPQFQLIKVPRQNFDPATLTAIFELRYIKPLIGEPSYTEEHIYQGLLNLLGGEVQKSFIPSEPGISTTALEAAFMSPQNAGTCARKSLEAVPKFRLKHHPKLYKYFKFKEKLAALKDFLEHNDLHDPKDQALLKRVLAKFARTVLKLEQLGVINQNEALNFYDLKELALNKLGKVNTASTPQPKLASDKTDFEGLSKLQTHKTAAITSTQAAPEVKKLHLKRPDLKNIQPQNLLENLKAWKLYIDSSRDLQENRETLYFLEDALQSLPTAFHENFWNAVSEKDIKQCAALMHELSKIYFDNCFNSVYMKDFAARTRAIINTRNVRACTFLLAKRTPELMSSLAGFSLNKIGYEYSVCKYALSAKDNLRIQELENFFENQKKLSSQQLYFTPLKCQTEIKKEDIDQQPDLMLMKKYLSFHPDLAEPIKRKILGLNINTDLRQITLPKNIELNILGLLYVNRETIFFKPFQFFPEPETIIPRPLPDIYQQIRELTLMEDFLINHNLIQNLQNHEFYLSHTLADYKYTSFDIFLSFGNDESGLSWFATKLPHEFSDEAIKEYGESIKTYIKENKILIDEKVLSKSKLPPAQIRELLQIRASDTLQIYEAMRFTQDHLNLLKDKDIQHYLELCFFENLDNSMDGKTISPQKTFAEFPLMIMHLNEFLANALTMADYDVELLTYFAKIAAKFADYVKLAQELNPEIKFAPFILPDYDSRLRTIFYKPGTSAAFKKEIALALIEIKSQKESLNAADIEDLIVMSSYITLQNKKGNFVTQEELSLAMKVIYEHKNKISKFMLKEQELTKKILNQALNTLGSQVNCNWEVPLNFGGFICVSTLPQNLVFDFLEASFFQNGVPLVGLPDEILNHKTYKEAFGITTLAMVFQDPFFKSADDSLRIKLDTTKKLIIQKKIPKENPDWYEFISQNDFELTSILPIAVRENCSLWMSCQEPKHVLLIDEHDQQLYDLDLSNKKVVRVPRNEAEPIYFLEKTETLFFARLANFELSSHILKFQEIRNPNKGRIEFPRFNLRFMVDGTNADLEDPKGYKLAANQNLGFLSSFGSYLVLENEKGEIFVLTPKSQKFSKASDLILLNELAKQKKVSFNLFKVNLLKEDLIASDNTPENHLTIALIFLINKNYEACFRHLQKTWQDEPYSKEALNIIASFKTVLENLTFDHTPEAHAICYHLGHLLIESTKTTPPKEEKSPDLRPQAGLIESFMTSYADYTKKLSNIPHYLEVKPEIELEMLNYLKGPLPEVLAERKKLLLAKTSGLQKSPLPENPLINLIKGLDEETSFELRKLWLMNQGSMVNPNQAIEDSFLFLLQEAIKPDPIAKRMILGYLTYYVLKDDKISEGQKTLIAIILTALFSPVPLNLPELTKITENEYSVTSDFFIFCKELLGNFHKNKQAILDKLPQILPAVSSGQEKALALSQQIIPISRISTLSLVTDPLIISSSSIVPPKTKHPLGEFAQKYFVKTWRKLVPKEIEYHPKNAPKSGLEQNLQQKLVEGLEKAKTVDTPVYQFDLPKLPELKKELTAEKKKVQVDVDHLLINLLTLANHFPPESKQGLDFELARLGEKKEPVTIDDLEMLLIQKDRGFLKVKNPFLSSEEIDQLFNAAIYYLELVVKVNQLKSALSIINKIDKETEPLKKNQLIQNLGEEIDQTRAFDPAARPEYLFFEAKAEMIMRQRNFEAIEELRTFVQKFYAAKSLQEKKVLLKKCHALVKQLIMGTGKTKVILPILGLALANGENLVTLMVPASLYETVMQQLKSVSQEFFQRKIYSFKFTRDMKMNSTQFSALEKRLTEVMLNKGSLLTTPESIQSLILKFIETLGKIKMQNELGLDAISGEALEELKAQAKILQRILAQFQEKGLLIGDEIDTLLNCRLEKIYPIGSRTGFEPVRWQFAFEMLQMLRSTGNFLTKEGLTPAQIETQAKPMFLARILQYFRDVKLPIPENQQQNFKAYLEGKIEAEKFIESYRTFLESSNLKPAPKDIIFWLNKIILAKEYYCHILPFTLEKKCQVNYGAGLDQKYELAVPYTGNMQPSKNSEFGHADCLIAFTLQNALLNGLTSLQVRKMLLMLQKNAQKSQEIIKPEQKLFASWLQNSDLKDLQINSIDLRDTELIEKIRTILNKVPEAVFHYYNTLVFPKMQIAEFKLSSNPEDIGKLICPIMLGFTGTPDNADTYPEGFDVTPIPEDTGRTLWQLLDPHISTIEILPSTNPHDFLRQIHLYEYHAFIDNGALFNGQDNETAAQLLFDHLTPKLFDGIVYFDDKTNQLVIKDRHGKIELLANSKIPMERRFTYYDNAHTTGTDVPQAISAKALRTVSHANSFRDHGQSAARMRKLGQGQSVINLIPSELGLRTQQDMIDFSISVEAAHLEKDVLFAAKQKIAQIKRKEDWQTLLTTPIEALSVKEISPFVSQTQTSIWDTCRFVDTTAAPEEVLTRLAQMVVQSQEALEEANKIIAKTVPLLPKQVPVRAENLELEMEEEQEQEEEEEQEQEQEVAHQKFIQLEGNITRYEQVKFAPNLKISSKEFLDLFTKHLPGNPNFFSLQKVYPDLQPHQNIFVTENFLRTIQDERTPLNPYMKTAHFYLEIWQKGALAPLVLLLSREDQDQILAKIIAAQFNEDDPIEVVGLFDQHGKAIIEAKKMQTDPLQIIEQKKQAHAYFLAQLKFLQGTTSYTKEQETLLKSWLTQTQKPKVQEFFTTLSRFTYNESMLHGSELESILS